MTKMREKNWLYHEWVEKDGVLQAEYVTRNGAGLVNNRTYYPAHELGVLCGMLPGTEFEQMIRGSVSERQKTQFMRGFLKAPEKAFV